MNNESKLIVLMVLKCTAYPINMGKVPIKGIIKPLAAD
jgi:hypothetical protein